MVKLQIYLRELTGAGVETHIIDVGLRFDGGKHSSLKLRDKKEMMFVFEGSLRGVWI